MEAFDTAEDRAFRTRSGLFSAEPLRRHPPAMLTGLPVGRELSDRWHGILLAKGWAAPNWPKEHGGTGWSLKQHYIFDQERAAAWAPLPVIFNIDMVGPLFIRYGTPDRISASCRACSRPKTIGARASPSRARAPILPPSNAAPSGRATATSSMAPSFGRPRSIEADMMFGLFRTDSSGKKQQGISVLVLPMDSKGLVAAARRSARRHGAGGPVHLRGCRGAGGESDRAGR